MAKFNKDEFKSKIETAVENAILKGLITKEDVESQDQERLDGFIRFQLAQTIEDRKWCVDILKDFNYDEKTSWTKLQDKYGKFTSLTDLALVNLWKFLENEGVTNYESYKDAINTALSKSSDDETLLDAVNSQKDVIDDMENDDVDPEVMDRMSDIDAEDLDNFKEEENESFINKYPRPRFPERGFQRAIR